MLKLDGELILSPWLIDMFLKLFKKSIFKINS